MTRCENAPDNEIPRGYVISLWVFTIVSVVVGFASMLLSYNGMGLSLWLASEIGMVLCLLAAIFLDWRFPENREDKHRKEDSL